MHPAVRVLVLIAVASALGAASLPALAVLFCGLLLAYLRLAADGVQRLRAGLWRMRWLLLAIFILYGGFTPGTALLPELPGLSREGLAEGCRRALVLVDLLVMVYMLITVTPVADLVASLRLLLAPLRFLGVDSQRLALRLALALDSVTDMQARVRGMRRGEGGWSAAVRLIEGIESRAVEPMEPVSVPHLRSLRWHEWGLPLVLLIVLHYWTP